MNEENRNPNNDPSPESDAGEASGGYTVRDGLIGALRTVYDPEIPVNIYDIGLIYKVEYDAESKTAKIEFTLTSPNCPAAEMIPVDIENAIMAVPGVKVAELDLVWEPPWTPDLMSEAARLELGIF